MIHEFAHLVLHKHGFVDEKSDLWSHRGREREANAFAGHFLVPDTFLGQINHHDIPEEVKSIDLWLRPFTKEWGVSSEVILRRLLESNFLDKRQYEDYREWKAARPVVEAGSGSRSYRHREPTHLFGDIFVKTVLDVLNSKNITLTRASSYLDNLKIADIHKLERFYDTV